MKRQFPAAFIAFCPIATVGATTVQDKRPIADVIGQR